MRLYIEATEQSDVDPEFIRIDVTDMTEVETKQVCNSIIDIMKDKKYVLLKHNCNHDTCGSCLFETI